MFDSTPAKPCRVAIIGGGIGGLALALGLALNTTVQYDVFEAKPTFSERGASVGLSENAQAALKHMGAQVFGTVMAAGAVPEALVRHKVGEGIDEGAWVDEKPGGYSVRRESWLKEILRLLPSSNLHADKKLVNLQQENDGVKLMFADGTIYHADAVVGCDGIRSSVRTHVLGDEAAEPKFAGFWDCRNLVSVEKLVEAFGTDLFDAREPYQMAIIGHDSFFLTQAIDGGTHCGIAAAGTTPPDWDPQLWKRPLTADFLRAKFAGWNPRFRDALVDCCLDQPEPRIFSQWESSMCETFVRGVVCIMGDAAHATTPWQGSGAGLALEDAAVLTALFARASSKSDIKAALRAYDETRRTRCQKVIESSRETGKISSGQYGIGVETLRRLYAGRWDFIVDLDMVKHVEYALKMVQEEKVEGH